MNDLNEGSETTIKKIDDYASIQEEIIKKYGPKFNYKSTIGTGEYNGHKIPHIFFPTLKCFIRSTKSYDDYPSQAKEVMGSAMYMLQSELGTVILASEKDAMKTPDPKDFNDPYVQVIANENKIDAHAEMTRLENLLKYQFSANNIFPRFEATDILRKTFHLVFGESYRTWRNSLESKVTPEAE